MNRIQWIELCKIVVDADAALVDLEQDLAGAREAMRHLLEQRRRLMTTLQNATAAIHQNQLEMNTELTTDGVTTLAEIGTEPSAVGVTWAQGRRPVRTRGSGEIEAFFRSQNYVHHAGVLRIGIFTDDPRGVWLTEEEATPVRARANAAKKGPLPAEMKVIGDNGA